MTDQKSKIENENLADPADPNVTQKPEASASPSEEKPNETSAVQTEPLTQSTDTATDREKLTKEQANKTRSKASKSPTSIAIECLFMSFNHETIRGFCHSYFPDLYKELRESDEFRKVIRLLVSYCDEQRITEELWLYIEKENLNQYKHYYLRWEKALSEQEKSKISSEDKRASSSMNEFIHEAHNIRRENPESVAVAGEGQVHPLSESDRMAINDWFYTELQTEEKSMVLTSAIFEGLNRKHMIPIFQEIERIFFGEQ